MLPVPKRSVFLLQSTLPREVSVMCAVALAGRYAGTLLWTRGAGSASEAGSDRVALASSALRASAALRFRHHPLRLQ